jgi:hypothetical protein
LLGFDSIDSLRILHLGLIEKVRVLNKEILEGGQGIDKKFFLILVLLISKGNFAGISLSRKIALTFM